MTNSSTINRHQYELLKNLEYWSKKPLLQKIYADYYNLIKTKISPAIPGAILEIGSGIGKSKEFVNGVVCTDLFPNPWIDVVCSGYNIPFKNESVSHIILFDVFHHLEFPFVFFKEARRVLAPDGRIIIFEPYISILGWIVYGLFHSEPIKWSEDINFSESLSGKAEYYAAQGNATRLFFNTDFSKLTNGWEIIERERIAGFSYVLSGGYSKPALYPVKFYSALKKIDEILSQVPGLFAVRCLVVLKKRA